MISNYIIQGSSIGNRIDVQPPDSTTNPQLVYPTLYDYFALLPALITAATPLILGLKRKTSQDRVQGTDQDQI